MTPPPIPDFRTLPPVVRAKLRREMLNLCRDLNVPVQVHRETGELLVDLGALCQALGLSEEEARATLDDQPGALAKVNPADVGRLN